MNILQNNEFHQTLNKKIQKIQKDCSQLNSSLADELKSVEKLISEKIQGEAWQHFETYFTQVHPEFTKKLSSDYPDLTAAELKLACFLRLNLSTKEIASLLFLTVDSVHTARTRLRKKLNLSSEDNLTNYLISF